MPHIFFAFAENVTCAMCGIKVVGEASRNRSFHRCCAYAELQPNFCGAATAQQLSGTLG